MIDSKKIVIDFALDTFSFLEDRYGFSAPVIKEKNWYLTDVAYLEKSIAIEMAFDFREKDVLILVVRLESGNFPAGYYVSNSKIVRKYLLNVINERKWKMSESLMIELRQLSRKLYDEVFLKQKLMVYRKILLDHIESLIREGANLF